MNFNLINLRGIGKRLLYSFLAILIITTIAVIVGIFAINHIKNTQNNILNNSIPAIVAANNLALHTSTLVEQSSAMKDSKSQDMLNLYKDKTLHLTNELSNLLIELEKYGIEKIKQDRLNTIVDQVKTNVTKRASILSSVLLDEENIEKKIEIMRNASQSLLDLLFSTRIEQEIKLSESVKLLTANNLTKDQLIKTKKLIEKNIFNVENVVNFISKSNEVHKSIQEINQSYTNESLLLTQQEFDHALRLVVRSIVNLEDELKKEKLIPHMLNLVKYGQDSPDIFELRREQINKKEKLADINIENVKLLHDLNVDLSHLVIDVQNKTRLVSNDLLAKVTSSRDALIVLLVVAILVSLLILWQFVYKKIIVKLESLQNITKKLSDDEYEFTINKEGDDEFSSINKTLDKLRINSKEKEIIHNQLEEQSISLKRSNEDLEQFAYVASHDLQEPLRMIGSYVQLLEKKYKGNINEEANKFIAYAVEGCTRMQSLIEGLLKFSRVDSSSEEMDDLNMHAVLSDVISDLSIKIKEENVDLKHENIFNVFARQDQVKIVFRNLIINAIKYCEEDYPKIKIESKIVANGKVQFSISDNGIGIDEQYKEKIFVIFKRLHSRSEYSGTGIGLSICKKIIIRHGGEIWLESTLGQGTTFYFTLPASKLQSKIQSHVLTV